MKHKLLSYLKNFVGFIILLSLALYLTISAYSHSFSEKVFSADNVYKFTDELSSQKYGGRLAGTDGNKLALKYAEDYFKSIGIKPAGDNGTYYQNLTTMVPMYNSTPIFDIVDANGKTSAHYTLGEDFREALGGFAGSGQGTGRLFTIEKNIRACSAAELKGSVLINLSSPQDIDIEYAIDNGATAIITPSPYGMMKNSSTIQDRSGKSIPIVRVTPEVLEQLLKYSKQNLSASIKLDISYKSLSTPNLLAKIEGSSKKSDYIILSAHIDGLGSEYDGRYFPGALDNASGVALVMELARDISLQKRHPDETIIFALWNSNEFAYGGSTYYTKNPLYPLNKSKLINFDLIGGDKVSDLQFAFLNNNEEALANKLMYYSTERGLVYTISKNKTMGDQVVFQKNSVPSVTFGDDTNGIFNNHDINTYNDTIKNISTKRIQMDVSPINDYLKHEVFKDNFNGMLSGFEETLLIILLAGIMFIYLTQILYDINPGLALYKIKIEDIYYSTFFNLMTRVYSIAVPAVIILLALVFIANLPQSFNTLRENGHLSSNISSYVIIKRSISYIRNLFTNGLGQSLAHFDVSRIILSSFARSMRLILSSIVVSLSIGLLKGASDGFKDSDRGSVRTLGTLSLLSLPDVLIVVLVQLLLIFFNNHGIFSFITSGNELPRFLTCLLCLSILPTVYISRIAAVAVKEEKVKDYVKAARAKGLTGSQVLRKHILTSAAIKVVDSLQSVLGIIISNLIIIEYLLYYPGIVYNIFAYYKEGDVIAFIGLILSMGVMYVVFILIFKLTAKLVNPLKREGSK